MDNKDLLSKPLEELRVIASAVGIDGAAEMTQEQLITKLNELDNKSGSEPKAKEMEKDQSIYKLFVGFQEWHQNEYGGKYVEIDQFNEYLETFKSE